MRPWLAYRVYIGGAMGRPRSVVSVGCKAAPHILHGADGWVVGTAGLHKRVEHAVIPRFGEAFDASQRYSHRPGAYAVLWDGRSMLVTFQEEPEPEFQLPGGGIDPGESPIRALHREVLEETGWRISSPRRLGAFRRFVYMPEYDKWAEKLCHIYLARPVLRLSKPLECAHSAIWMSPVDAAQKLGNYGDRAFVENWIESGLPMA